MPKHESWRLRRERTVGAAGAPDRPTLPTPGGARRLLQEHTAHKPAVHRDHGTESKKKEDALVEAARRREEACNRHAARALEKERKDREKAQKAAEALARENFRQQWTTEAI